MSIKILVILLVMGLVLGTYSISNYAMAASQDIGKIAPTDKISPSASPPGFEKAGMVRVISSTTSEQGISEIQQKGCSVVHRLNDATSFSCPSKVVSTIDNVRPVKVYQPHDLDADKQIQADRVWNELGFNGSGVKVAILDTGVQKSHAELSDSVSLTRDFTGETGDDLDFNGHGTHVSGIVTSNGILYYGIPNLTTGVAPGADIIVGKVCGDSGCPEDDIIAGIEWAQDQGADVMNLSLGGGLSSAENCDSTGDLLVTAVNNAVASGIVATISSGNDNSKIGVSYPACASGAIAVGAVDSSDKVARFSNSGPALDIVAPGVSILSTYSCSAAGDCDSTWAARLSGTSMSAPHVAGVAALILQKNPTLTVEEVKDALYSTAVDVGKFDGNGRVDAFAAVNYVQAATTPDTTPPVITGATGNTASTTGEATTISATITDDVLVSSATVHYTPIDGTETTIPMTQGTGNIWSADVPVALDKVGTIAYYITATDIPNSVRDPLAGTYSITVTDNDSPIAPSSLTASVVSSTQINLNWGASTDNVAVTGYHVFRDGFKVAEVTGTSYSDTSLIDGTTYTYFVQAFDAAGNMSPASASVSATPTTPDTTPPSITGATGNTASTTGEATTISATITDDVLVSSAIVHYTPIDGTETTIPMTQGTGNIWSADVPVALDKVGTIAYYITATDPAPNPVRDPLTGTYSITVTDNDSPIAPSSLTASVVSSTQIDLNWGASIDNVAVTGYQVFRDGVNVATVTGTSYSDTSLIDGTTYTYFVQAFDAAGNMSPASALVSATPTTPDTLSVTINSDSTTYSQKSFAYITVNVTAGTSTVSGASVTLTVTNSDGVKTQSGTTDGDGKVTFKYRISPKAPLGEYTAEALVSALGFTSSASTIFTVTS